MEQNYVVLQGKLLEVDLESMYGSSAFGWCLSALPKELILLRENIVPIKPGIAPVLHKFYFGVMSAENINVEINFVLAAFHELPYVADTFTAKVRIVPSDAAKFVSDGQFKTDSTPSFRSGNEQSYNRMDMANDSRPYGYPYVSLDTPFFPAKKKKKTKNKRKHSSDVTNNVRAYGYPCMASDETDGRLYGYPCGVQDAALKYGYSCGVQDAVLKYGYPNC